MSLNSQSTETPDSRPYWQGAPNPFQQAAVARAYALPPEQITIRTEAIAAADQFVGEYLDATAAPAGPAAPGSPGRRLGDKGRTCIIEGDFGTGKTHLASVMLSRLERARASGRGDARIAYQVVPGESFLSVYAGIVKEQVGESEMTARVRERYAGIVADELRKRPFAEDLAARVRRDDVDPQVVVERYGLKEGAIRDKLRRELAEITPDDTFGRVLMLLLQRELRPLAWRWLTGESPDAALIERGITRPIATDVQAMEALGVVARLHCRDDLRFAVVIDELEKLAPGWDPGDMTLAQAFKRLLMVFRESGALLVACGLPDIFERLPRDPGRVDAIIAPSRLTEDNVRSYVTQTQRKAFGREVQQPFTDEGIRYITYLTEGVARDVVRICYRSFGQAAETGREITPALVRQVARDRLPSGGAERVRGDVADILTEEGWLPERRGVPAPVADFWIPGEGDGAGCAILVRDSVLERSEAKSLGDEAKRILEGRPDRAVLIVVAGYLPPGPGDVLTSEVGQRFVVVYHARTFREDFTAALQAAMERAGGIVGAGPAARRAGPAADELRMLRTAFDRLGRQQTSTLRAVQELLRGQSSVAESLSRLGPPPVPPPAEESSLPRPLETMFARAWQALEAYGDVRHFLDQTFEIASRQPGQRFPLAHRLRAADVFASIGMASYLADLLSGFRASVRSWLAEAGPTAEDRDRLREICLTYDSLYGIAEVYRLDPLPARLRVEETGQEGISRSARREDLEEALGALGDRVYLAALDAAGAGEP